MGLDNWQIERRFLSSYLVIGGINIDAGCGGRKVTKEVLGLDIFPRGYRTHLDLSCETDIVGSIIEIDTIPGIKHGSVDTVVMNHVSHLFPKPHDDIPKMFSAVFRVLKTNGLFAINDLDVEQSMAHIYSSWPHHFWSNEEYREFGETVGFITVSCANTAPKWSSHWVGRKPLGRKPLNPVNRALTINKTNCRDLEFRKDWSPCFCSPGYSFNKTKWLDGYMGPVWEKENGSE